MSDKNDPPAQGTPRGGAYSSSVGARVGEKEGFFRRFLNWLAPPEEGGGSAPSGQAAQQESVNVKLTLPGGGQISFKAKELRETAPNETEVILEPPPDNPAALLKVLAEFLGVPMEGYEATPSRSLDTDDSLPAVVALPPPPKQSPLASPPPGLELELAV